MGLLELIVPLIAAGGWLWWLRRTDRFEREPWGLVLKTAGLGAVAGLVGLMALTVLIMVLSEDGGAIALILLLVPLHVVGMTAAIYLLPYRRSEWNEPLDGVIYGGAAGIGYGLTFTTVWSLVDTAGAGFRSALFSIPTFMLTGLIIGHYTSQARFGPPHKARAMMRRGLMIPGLFLLGFELAQFAGGEVMGGDNPVASVVVYAANTAGWLVAMWAMDIGRKASPYDPANYRFQLAASGCVWCHSAYPVGATYCSRCGRPVAGGPVASGPVAGGPVAGGPWEVPG